MIDLLGEAIGFVLEALSPAVATDAPAEADQAATPAPRPSRGEVLIRWLTLLFGAAFVILTVGALVLWATGWVGTLTAIGIVLGALIAGRIGYLLTRYRRHQAGP